MSPNSNKFPPFPNINMKSLKDMKKELQKGIEQCVHPTKRRIMTMKDSNSMIVKEKLERILIMNFLKMKIYRK